MENAFFCLSLPSASFFFSSAAPRARGDPSVALLRSRVGPAPVGLECWVMPLTGSRGAWQGSGAGWPHANRIHSSRLRQGRHTLQPLNCRVVGRLPPAARRQEGCDIAARPRALPSHAAPPQPNPRSPRARSRAPPLPRRSRDETCPVSTGGETRRVQLVREGGGGGGGACASAAARSVRAALKSLSCMRACARRKSALTFPGAAARTCRAVGSGRGVSG